MKIRIWTVTREADFEVTLLTFGCRDDCLDFIYGTDVRFEIEGVGAEEEEDGCMFWRIDEECYLLSLEYEDHDLEDFVTGDL